MKKLIAIASLILVYTAVFAQTVEIPDARFKACLLTKHPDLMDPNQELIISQAQAFSGKISCIGYNIVDIEGFQYFNNVNDVNFSRNLIEEIDTFPVNNVLTRLVLDDNLMTSLPDLSVFPELKTFTVKRNNLTSLPDLSSNTKMTQLYAESNQLVILPELKELKQLWAIDVSDNRIVQLPALDSLKKLEELVVADNELTEIQSLQNLESLTFVDISGNKISTLPEVAPGNLITTVDISNNRFSELPDFSLFPNLDKAFLDDNYFTFSDLLPLKSLADNETVFPLTSQKIIEAGKSYEVRKNENLFLSTAIDTGITEVRYKWFFEGKEVQEATDDRVKVFTDLVSSSGFYYCRLSHPEFTNLTLRTDSFYVKVNPCFEKENFVVEVFPRNCTDNFGEIRVSSSAYMPSGFAYQLVSARTADTFTSLSGRFSGLKDPEYYLYGNIEGCKEQIGDKIYISEQECENAYLTLDGDGADDVYYLDYQGQAKVLDKFGNTVQELQLPGYWDGSGNGGKVAPGLYYIDINGGEKLVKITVVY